MVSVSISFYIVDANMDVILIEIAKICTTKSCCFVSHHKYEMRHF
jgi:hypothetical protein